MRLGVAVGLALLLGGCVSSRVEQQAAVARGGVEACRARIAAGEFKLHVQRAECVNAAESQLMGAYANSDLLSLRMATRMQIAQRIDRGEITEIDGAAEFARLNTQIGTEERSRNLNAAVVRAATKPTTCTGYGNSVTCY